MKPSRFLTFHLLCLTVSLTLLLTVTQADDKLKTTKAQTQTSQSVRFIQFANDLLTVNAQDVPLKELLDEIARQSGLSVVVCGSLNDKITMEFHNLALGEGMRLILRHHSKGVTH